MRKISCSWLILVLIIIVGCGNQDDTLRAIHQAEYQRIADTAQFSEWLKSPDTAIRLQAVRTLGRIQDTSSIQLLLDKARDNDPRIRAAVAFSLGQIKSLRTQKALLSIYTPENNDTVRARIIDALGKTATTDPFTNLSIPVEKNAEEIKKSEAIATAMLAYRHINPQSVIDSLTKMYRTTDNKEVKWRCAYAFYRISDTKFLPLAVRSVLETDALTRYFSLKMISNMIIKSKNSMGTENSLASDLNEISNSPKFISIIHTLSKDPDWFVRMANIELIQNLKDPSLFQIVESATQDPQPHVRQQAIAALAKFPNHNAKQLLLKIINNAENWRDSGLAIEALSEMAPQPAINIIEQQIGSRQWPQDYYLIKALGNIDNEDSNRILLELYHGNNTVQMNQVLEVLGERKSVPLQQLLSGLTLADLAVTTTLAGYVAEAHDTSAARDLILAYKKFSAPQDIEPMQAILVALDSLRLRSTVPFLEDVIRTPFPAIEESASKALFHITGKNYSWLPAKHTVLTKYNFPVTSREKYPMVRFSTSKGSFTMKLDASRTPVTVANFLKLVSDGFYNGIYIHRVVPGFVVQAGDPRGDGWGGPGYTIPSEDNSMLFDRGVVGIATAGKDTGSSQFFIMQLPAPHLNGRYTAFGKVIAGMDVVDNLEIYDKILTAKIVGK